MDSLARSVAKKGFLIKDILGMEAHKGRKEEVGFCKKGGTNSKFRQRRPRLGGVSAGQRRRRTAFSRPQLAFLERKFQCQKYLTLSDRGQVADQLSLSEAQIKCWFQNRRTKWKRQTSLAVRADQLREHAVHHQNGCPHQAFEPQETTSAEDSGHRGQRQRSSMRGNKVAASSSLSDAGEAVLACRFTPVYVSQGESVCRQERPAMSTSPLVMERTCKGFSLPPFLTAPLSFFHHSAFPFSTASARY